MATKTTTHKQLIERWQNVLRVLRALTPHQRRKHFAMNSFGYQDECGTIACAAGHCSLDPWFRRRGFKSVVEDDELQIVGYDDYMDYDLNAWGVGCVRFFGRDGADKIFFNDSSRPVSQVIREVRAHIKSLESQE